MVLTTPCADTDLLARMDAAVFPEPWSAGDISALLHQGGCAALVAGDDAPLGYLIYRVVVDEAEVIRLGVPPVARRRGVGRAMMEGLLEACRGAGVRRIFLELRASNQAALGLYHAMGFARTGVRRGYYSAPVEDAVLMEYRA